MAFVTLEDGKSTTECIIFPRILEEKKEIIIEGNAVVMKGHLSEKDDETKFIANDIVPITPEDNINAQKIMSTRRKYNHIETNAQKTHNELPDETTSSALLITLPDQNTYDAISKIKNVLDTYKDGKVRVFLIHNDHRIKTAYKITPSPDCIHSLEMITGIGSIKND
jgi:DNA polymerase III alpha subunit